MSPVDTGVFCQFSLELNLSVSRPLVLCGAKARGDFRKLHIMVRAAAEGQARNGRDR